MYRFFTRCKKELFLFLITNFVWAGIGISLAYILEFVADTAVHGIDGRIKSIILLAISYLFLDTIFEFASSYTEVLLRTKISLLLRNTLVCRIQNCSVEQKEKMGDAFYLSMLNNNVTEVETEYIHGILMVVFQIFSLVFALIATTLIQPFLTFIIIVLCVIPIFVPRILKNKLEKVNRDAIDAKATYMNLLNEFLEGFLTIKVFCREKEINQYHNKINAEMTKKGQINSKWKRISMSLSYGMGNMVVLGAWVFGAIFALAGSITFPQLIALTTLMNMVAGPFQIISEYYSGIISGHAIAKDLIHFIDSEENEGRQYKSYESNVNTLELKSVSVIREGHYVLDKVNFSAFSGQKICVIGKSGSGKSSLLKVLAGIMEIQEGNLNVNNCSVGCNTGITHPDLLLLSQSTTLFSASIGDNISLFKKIPEHRVEDAIHRSGLLEWFKSVGEDINKNFQKSSANLSGGELRRVDFARTLVEDAKIVLFDEPTTGLDSLNARNIMEQICSMENRIVIVATHDLEEENILRFDYVYMIDDGRVVAHNTPNNIIHNPMYISLKKGDLTELRGNV